HGFDAWARPDHLLAEGVLGPPGAPLLECFTTTAALVEATSRIRFLQTVACNSFRHPALLAKMVASLDVISGGRMELGLGAGWLQREYEAYGYDFPPPAVRLAQLREALQIVKRLWTGEAVDYDGAHYRLRDAVCAPAPVQRPRPPILVGGGGAGLLAVAAAEELVRRFTIERFRAKAGRVRELAAAAGRDPNALTLSAIFFVQLAASEAKAAELLDAVGARYRLDRAAAERFPLVLVGTPAQLRERLAERIAILELGYVVLNFADADALARFAADVLPSLRT